MPLQLTALRAAAECRVRWARTSVALIFGRCRETKPQEAVSQFDRMQGPSQIAIFALLVGCTSQEPAARASALSQAPSHSPLKPSGESARTDSTAAVVVAAIRAPVLWDNCIRLWSVESCSRTDMVSFDEGALVLTSLGRPASCRVPGNQRWETTKLTQSAPDGDFEATTVIESFEGTSHGVAVFFLADAAGVMFLSASAGGFASGFRQEVYAKGTPTGALGLYRARVQTASIGDTHPRDISGTFTLIRRGKRATITLATSVSARFTDAVTLPPGSYVVGVGIEPHDSGTTSVRFTEFRALDRSGKLKTDTFDCLTGESP